MSSYGTAEDRIDGDGRGVTPCFLQEEHFERVGRKRFFQKTYEGGGDGVGVEFLQMNTVREFGVEGC